MAGLTPNSSNIDRVQRSVSQAIYLVTHPEYQYWRTEWQKLRDCIAGQREIKRKTLHYLQAMKAQDADDYALYLERATFYNMTAQTLNGMVGQVYRRDPVIKGLPAKFKDAVRRFAKDGSGQAGFSKTVMTEQLGLGRFGVLIDAPAVPQSPPTSYAVGYAAENILDWTVEDVDGFYQPTRILLREFERDTGAMIPPPGDRFASSTENRGRRKAVTGGMVRPTARTLSGYSYKTVYRELLLEWQADGSRAYVQYLYEDDPTGIPKARYEPMVRGRTLDFIPFKMFGSASNAWDIEKPPLLDIADLNLSHYRTYAELEYGRLFTALPIYYAPGKDDDGAAEYHIGPNLVWEVPPGSEPGILEFTGQGLGALEKALADKERQIAAIGGRLMPGSSKSVSESNNQTSLREANEQALLLNVILATETGMTEVVRWWLMWRDIPLSETEGLRYEVNTDFLSTQIGAREIRAIQMRYADGLITDSILYNYLRKAEIIPSEMTLEEFQVELKDENSFINNPDAQARQRGFHNRAQELEQAQLAREADFAQQQLDLDDRRTTLEEEKLAIAAKAGSTSVTGSRKLGDPEQAKPARENPKPKPTPVAAQAGLPGAKPKPAV